MGGVEIQFNELFRRVKVSKPARPINVDLTNPGTATATVLANINASTIDIASFQSRKVFDQLGWTKVLNDARAIMNTAGGYVTTPDAGTGYVTMDAANTPAGVARRLAERMAKLYNSAVDAMAQYKLTFDKSYDAGSTVKEASEQAFKIAKLVSEQEMRVIEHSYPISVVQDLRTSLGIDLVSKIH